MTYGKYIEKIKNNPDYVFTRNGIVTWSMVKNLLNNIQAYNEVNTPEFYSDFAIGLLPHTIQHKAKISSALEDFHYCLSQYTKEKLKALPAIISFDKPGTLKGVPCIFLDVAGEKQLEKEN